MPVARLKYLPKTDCEGKLRVSAICCMLIVVDDSNALQSVVTYCSITSLAGRPVCSFTTCERYLTVMQSRSA